MKNEATSFQFVSIIEDAAPEEPSPSPPPQELSTRRIAERINQHYMIPREIQKIQEQDNMLDMFDRSLDYAQDIEDVPTHSNPEPLNYNSTSGIGLSADGSDDYYADMPDFVYQDVTDPLKCKCLDCDEDDVCGGLWKGKRYPGDYDLKAKKIHIVVSHCMSDLDWIPDFTKGYDVASIHVISKCGEPVKGAPEAATIEVLPNIGRCDHTYVKSQSC